MRPVRAAPSHLAPPSSAVVASGAVRFARALRRRHAAARMEPGAPPGDVPAAPPQGEVIAIVHVAGDTGFVWDAVGAHSAGARAARGRALRAPAATDGQPCSRAAAAAVLPPRRRDGRRARRLPPARRGARSAAAAERRRGHACGGARCEPPLPCFAQPAAERRAARPPRLQVGWCSQSWSRQSRRPTRRAAASPSCALQTSALPRPRGSATARRRCLGTAWRSARAR